MVVFLATRRFTCARQRRTRVFGQTTRTAFLKPAPPSVITIAGGASLTIRAAHDSEHSLRARCRAATCSCEHAMGMTSFLVMCMPSTNRTSCGMRKWPELPEPLRPSLKGCLRAALLLERSFAHKPLQKRFEAFGCAVNAMRHARAAFLTSPSCGARRCGAIPLHLPATSTASRIIQAHLLSFSNFFF